MILCLVLVAATSAKCSSKVTNSVKAEEEYLTELKIYSSLGHLLSFFRNHTDSLAHKILETFLNDCRFPTSSGRPRDSLMKPVVVIEGNHKSSRDVMLTELLERLNLCYVTHPRIYLHYLAAVLRDQDYIYAGRDAVVMGLLKLLNARYVTHPAPCLHRYHPLLPKASLLRRAYYLLSNYAGSNYARSRFDRPIIINGYWTEQLAFTLTHFYPPGGLPPVSSGIFQFPDDLLKPDLVFYLDFPDRLIHRHVTTKSPLDWKPRMLEAFHHMQGRHPIVVKEMKPFFKLTVEEIHRDILEHMYVRVFRGSNSTVTERKTD